MACAPAPSRPASVASRQSAPRCPAVATVDIAFLQAATPGPASSRQTSRCESSVLVSPTSRTHSSPAHFCLQYNTASAPKAWQPFWKLSLSLCFLFSFTLYTPSIDQLSPYPSSPLFEPPSGPRRRLQGCRPAPFTVRYISDQAHPASFTAVTAARTTWPPYFSLCPLVNSRKASPG